MKNRYQNVPQALRERDRWVVYTLSPSGDGGKMRKIPYDAKKNGIMALVNDPGTWSDYETAVNAVQEGRYDGIGFVLGDDIVGIDLDHVLVDGHINEETQAMIDLMDSYTEISPSGEGLHIFVFGQIPGTVRRKGNVEMYSDRRYFTVTGDMLPDSHPVVENRSAEVVKFYDSYLRAETATVSANIVNRPVSAERMSAENVIQRAALAKNGEKFFALMGGDISDYDSQSNADLALCNMIAFYAEGDPLLIDEVFRTSALMRKKWDEKRGGRTYGERTIEKAIADLTAVATPQEKPIKKRTTVKKTALQDDSVHNAPVQTIAFPGTVSAADWAKQLGGKSDGVCPTGLPALDQRLGGGFGPGLYVLGAAPSVGKTTLALQWARSFAANGSPVLFASYEQSNDALTGKLLSALAAQDGLSLPGREVARGRLSEQAARVAEKHAAVLSRIVFPDVHAGEGGEKLLTTIAGFADACAGGEKLPVVFVDYLQAVTMQSGSGVRFAIDAFVSGLREVIRTRRVCVCVISSTSRASYLQSVQLDSLKESGGIEFAGDVIFGLHYAVMRNEAFARKESAEKALLLDQEKAKPVRQLELTCLKNREDEANYAIRLDFEARKGLFSEK